MLRKTSTIAVTVLVLSVAITGIGAANGQTQAIEGQEQTVDQETDTGTDEHIKHPIDGGGGDGGSGGEGPCDQPPIVPTC